MQEIQKRKRQLEKELKEVIDRFHKENEIYAVKYVSVKSNPTISHGREEKVTNSPVKVEVNIEVL